MKNMLAEFKDFINKGSLVDLAIAVQEGHGTMAAANYLKEAGIAFTVALRVLTRPHRRRYVS